MKNINATNGTSRIEILRIVDFSMLEIGVSRREFAKVTPLLDQAEVLCSHPNEGPRVQLSNRLTNLAKDWWTKISIISLVRPLWDDSRAFLLVA
jgi:hypothetical protein